MKIGLRPKECSIDVPEDPHRQPRRDRASHPASLPRTRHSLGRGAFHRGCRCDARAAGGRKRLHRTTAGEGQLPQYPCHPVRRPGDRRRGDPSRLRLPRRERRLRRDGGSAWPDLHRPLPRAYPHDGRQDHRQDGDGKAGRAAGARIGRCGCRCGKGTRRRRADRLSGAGQGHGRRRRSWHEGGARRRLARGGVPHRPHRGTCRVRQRRGVHREVSRPPAPYRAAGAGGRPRQRGAFRRARLQPAAAPPEVAGGSRLAGAEHRRTRQARRHRDRGVDARSATATPARWSSCIRTASSPSSR